MYQITYKDIMIATISAILIQLSCSKYTCALLVCKFLVVERYNIRVIAINSPASVLYSHYNILVSEGNATYIMHIYIMA